MIEITFKSQIEPGTIVAFDSDNLQEYVEDRIANGIFEEIEKHLEEMAFIEMEPTEDNGFDITAELVLCSKQEIVTTAELQAVKLAKYGLNEEQILDVLETQLETTGGF